MSFQTKQSLTLVIARFGMVLLAVCAAVAVLALVFSRALPGGGAIGFLSFRDGNTDIYVLDIARGTLHNVTDNGARNGGLAFSPDGTRIAFTSDKDGNNEIYMMSLECPDLMTACGGIVQVTDDDTDSGSPAWSPEGRRIAYVHDEAWNNGNNEIYVVDVESSETVNISNDAASDSFPTWSPDGTRIAFLSDRDGLLDVIFDTDLYIVNTDGSDLERVTTDMTYYMPSVWSPDGRYIAFPSPQNHTLVVTLLDLQTGEFHNLSVTNKLSVNPVWSHDGRDIAFTARTGDVSDICVMNTATDDMHCILTAFDGRLDNFSWSPTSDLIVLNSEFRLYMLDVARRTLRHLMDIEGVYPAWWPERTP